MRLAHEKLSTVRLGGRVVRYRVRYSPAAKRSRIQVGPAGVTAVLPRGRPAREAAALLKRNAAWVESQIASISRLGEIGTTKGRPTVLLRGRETEVSVEKHAIRFTPRVALAQDQIRLTLPRGTSANRALECWMRRLARRELCAALTLRAAEMKVRAGRLFIRGQRTKWGNCSGLRNVSFNWRLIMAPPAVLDYVVVHELAHLIEPAHSHKFWLIVRSHCPGYAAHVAWLRSNEHRMKLL
jgi:predicted metal-dependent hydrolase